MTDLYNHYNGVEPSSISSAVTSLQQKVKTAQEKLTSFKTSLSDSVWKAGAKETLFTAFNTLDSEVYTDIIDKLDNLSSIAEYIQEYNNAKSKAETYLGNLNSSTKDTPESNINSWRKNLNNEEATMRECVANINSLL